MTNGARGFSRANGAARLTAFAKATAVRHSFSGGGRLALRQSLRSSQLFLEQLLLVELRVQAASGDQLVMRPALRDPSTVKDEDLIRLADRGNPVRDDD